MTTETIKIVGDIGATTLAIGVVINWLTVASLILTIIGASLTIGWWTMRWYEKLTLKQFEDIRWIKWIFRRT